MFNGQVANPDSKARPPACGPGGNHYFFDLNRALHPPQPETRARVSALREWNCSWPWIRTNGAVETYLFSLAERSSAFIAFVSQVDPDFAENQAKAFDRHGWFTTRGNGSTTGIPATRIDHAGAIMILYEQAGGVTWCAATTGIMTYRETVHHQITVSLSNLGTLAEPASHPE